MIPTIFLTQSYVGSSRRPALFGAGDLVGVVVMFSTGFTSKVQRSTQQGILPCRKGIYPICQRRRGGGLGYETTSYEVYSKSSESIHVYTEWD